MSQPCCATDRKPPRPPALTPAALDHIFSHQGPTLTQFVSLDNIRDAAKAFAAAILAETSPCADQTAAVRQVREACATACQAVLLEGRV